MGHSLHIRRALLPPLSELFERYVTITPGRTVVSRNGFFKVIYFLEGGLEMELPDGTRIPLEAGDAVSLSHAWLMRYRSREPSQEARLHVLVLRLAGGELAKKRSKAARPSEEEFAVEVGAQLRGFHHFPNALGRGVARSILQRLRSLLHRGAASAPSWKIGGLALALLTELMERPESLTKAEEKPLALKGETAFQHARDYLLQNYQERLSLSQIAWQVRLSGEHLERLFQRYGQTTVFEFLDQTRIDRARQLLLTTDWPVRQIASLSGYSSSTLLGRHFKAKMGVTPLEFRLQGREEESFSPSRVQLPLPAER